MSDVDLLPERVSHIDFDGREVWLVPTAHVSKESVEDVRATVEAVEPDTICIELCRGRYEALTNQDSWQKMDVVKIVRQGKAMMLLAQLILSSFYRKLGERLGVKPGAEMLEGARLAEEKGVKLELIDRDVQITLRRVYGYLGFWRKLVLASHLMVGLMLKEEIDEEAIERMKHQDQLEAVMAEFATKYPEIKERLIDERDVYLAQKIRRCEGKRIVAVVGAGHVEGMKEHIMQDEPLAELEKMPPRSIWPTILKWGIPLLIVGIFGLGFLKGGSRATVTNVYIWILVNGVLSAIGAALAMGHPLTILSAFLAAPLTSLNPLMAAGWVAGLVQAAICRPTVRSLEDLPNSVETLKGWWHNPVTRILLVVALANLGSVIGTYVGGTWIFTRSV
jgi:pheromone shutdown-related protein TraB